MEIPSSALMSAALLGPTPEMYCMSLSRLLKRTFSYGLKLVVVEVFDDGSLEGRGEETHIIDLHRLEYRIETVAVAADIEFGDITSIIFRVVLDAVRKNTVDIQLAKITVIG